ncbi:hypothetical protein CCAX7_35630 [Capsulimonas corticalis]|uniref:Uncharacterized protein n=1 Tax=Capsulimonas corticalis TaxID=2219043 RepID=A0A402D6A7_9BACT|nr:hypothetical protein [Capsulimonas corticalis]BDI31512.1 hypothetical protein CCAX7_35630 [Capsulimonas corticalis]
MFQPSSIDEPFVLAVSVTEVKRSQDRSEELFGVKPELRLIREMYDCAKGIAGLKRLSGITHNIDEVLAGATDKDPYIRIEAPGGQITIATRFIPGPRPHYDLQISGLASLRMFVTSEQFELGLQAVFDQIVVLLEMQDMRQ